MNLKAINVRLNSPRLLKSYYLHVSITLLTINNCFDTQQHDKVDLSKATGQHIMMTSHFSELSVCQVMWLCS